MSDLNRIEGEFHVAVMDSLNHQWYVQTKESGGMIESLFEHDRYDSAEERREQAQVALESHDARAKHFIEIGKRLAGQDENTVVLEGELFVKQHDSEKPDENFTEYRIGGVDVTAKISDAAGAYTFNYDLHEGGYELTYEKPVRLTITALSK